jgi:hypothetical protein
MAKPTQAEAPLPQRSANKQTPQRTTSVEEAREIEEPGGKRVVAEQSRRIRRRRDLVAMEILGREFDVGEARAGAKGVTGSVSYSVSCWDCEALMSDEEILFFFLREQKHQIGPESPLCHDFFFPLIFLGAPIGKS